MINENEKSAVATGLEILDKLESLWYKLEQDGYVNKDAWFQTVRDVINGEYFG